MEFDTTLKIGPLDFDSPFILAPLAGYSDLPFRLLCRRYGAGYCVSEMISCHGLVYQQSKTLQMLKSVTEEKPVSFQLFGADPDVMVEAAQILASYQPEMLDINMGCPVRKVTKRGAGAALMTTPAVAQEIVTRIVKEITIPVTVKIRSGPNFDTINAVPFAMMLEDCGAAAVTVHGRTWSQAFSGTSDPKVISEVKKALKIPVIGNGDVLSLKDGFTLMRKTGCDGVMIGRGALGNPWVFTTEGRPTTVGAITTGALAHLLLIEKFLPAERVLGYIKNHMSRYYKGLHGCSQIRQDVFACQSVEQLREYLETLAI